MPTLPCHVAPLLSCQVFLDLVEQVNLLMSNNGEQGQACQHTSHLGRCRAATATVPLIWGSSMLAWQTTHCSGRGQGVMSCRSHTCCMQTQLEQASVLSCCRCACLNTPCVHTCSHIRCAGTVLRSDVTGRIIMKCHLSDMPEVRVGINDRVEDATFHQVHEMKMTEAGAERGEAEGWRGQVGGGLKRGGGEGGGDRGVIEPHLTCNALKQPLHLLMH